MPEPWKPSLNLRNTYKSSHVPISAGSHFLPGKYQFVTYQPHANVREWLRRMFQNLVIGICSFVVFTTIVSYVGPLQTALFAFFRWVLIPVKILLVAQPSTSAVWLVNIISMVANWIDLLMIPLVVFAAYKTFEPPLRLAFAPTRLLLLARAPDRAGAQKSAFERELIHAGDEAYEVFKEIPYESVEKISVERAQGKKSVLDYSLHFLVGDKVFKVRWGDILKAEERDFVIDKMEEVFADKFDRKAFEPLKRLPDRQSYTELWLREFSGAPKRDSLTPLPDGSTLQNGRYEIVQKLGTGGQATVYLAHDADSGNAPVVVKEFVLPVYPDLRIRMQAAQRFQAEASMLSTFKHDQIAKFIDLMVEDHRAYLVLEHVEGTTLKEKVAAQGVLPESQVIDIARQLVEIVSYLHGHEPPIVHRDLSPDNMIMGGNGAIKLIDFSVAQEDTTGITGVVVGKPNYISPEQFRGKPTTQSDIYSLGATLYFLLVGKDPPPITVLHPRLTNESISKELDALIAHCTELEPSKRFLKCEDIKASLAQLTASTALLLETKKQLSGDESKDAL